MTLDGIPYIGRFSSQTPEWYVATGFGKWGMSHSMVSARLLTDLITGKENPYVNLFTPSRLGWNGAVNLAKQAGCSLKGYVGRKKVTAGEYLEDLEPGEGHLVEYGKGKIGAYRDEEGALHLVTARCLIWAVSLPGIRMRKAGTAPAMVPGSTMKAGCWTARPRKESVWCGNPDRTAGTKQRQEQQSKRAAG